MKTNREQLVIVNRTKNDSGTLLIDNSTIPDNLFPIIYPICNDNIKGSCEDFHTRINISEKLSNDNRLKSFDNFKKYYKINQVAIVASQKLRAIALLGQEHWQEYEEMKVEHYVILESIGLKRWHGEMNFGKEAPKFSDNKIKLSFYYLRKFLIEKKFIIPIGETVYTEKRRQTTFIALSFLPRFRPTYLHQNDSKIIELSKEFIRIGRTTVPATELKNILMQYGIQPFTLKMIRKFFLRYTSIIKIHEKPIITLEYLKTLDRPLNYDDFIMKCVEEEKMGPMDNSINEEDNDFIDDENTEIEMNELSNVNNDFHINFEPENINDQLNYGDFNYDEFFNKKTLQKIDAIDYQIKMFDETFSYDDNFMEKLNEKISSTVFLRKFIIIDQKFQNELKYLPKFKTIITRDGKEIKISHTKLQQLPRYILYKFYWLVNLIGKISRVEMIKLFDLPNTLIRNLLKFWLDSKDFIYSVQCVGRQSVFIFETKFNSTCISPSDLIINNHFTFNKTIELRAKLILEHLQMMRFIDNLTLLRHHILEKEKNLGFLIDMKSIIRIVNELATVGKIYVYGCTLSYKTNVRKSIFMIYRDDEIDLQLTFNHLYFRTIFFYFGLLPINWNQINVTPLMDNHKMKLNSVGVHLHHNNLNVKPEIENINDSFIYPAIYRPKLATSLYQCNKIKIEKTFQLYRFLFYLLVEDEQPIVADWQTNVPKLTNILKNRQFCLLDIILYIPLIILVDIVSIRFEVCDLAEYIADKQKQKLMLHELPAPMRSQLLLNQKIKNEIQDLLLFLTKFRLLTLIQDEKICEKKKLLNRMQFILNIQINFNIADNTLKNEYLFNSIADFDQFVDAVYNHLINSCVNCPFDPELKIHSLKLPILKKFAPMENIDKSKKGNKRKLKVDLNKNRKKLKMDSDGNQNVLNGENIQNRKSKKKKMGNRTKLKEKITKKNKNRAKWSRAEDHFLLKCYITSLLINPNLINRFCVSYDVIFKLFQEYISADMLDKGRQSIIRRFVRLVHRPYIKRVISMCLIELKMNVKYESDSNDIIKRFEHLLDKVLNYNFINTEFFMTEQQLKKDQNFLSTNSVSEMENDIDLNEFDIIIPCCETSEHYYNQPKNCDDIYDYVISNLVMSSLLSFTLHHQSFNTDVTNISDRINLKPYFMRTIFKALKYFPDALVRKVLKRLTKFRFITHNKMNDKPYGYKLPNLFLHNISSQKLNYLLKLEKNKTNEELKMIFEDNNTLINVLQFCENFCVEVLNLNNNINDFSFNSRENFNSIDKIYPPTIINNCAFSICVPDNFIWLSKNIMEEYKTVSRSHLINKNSSIETSTSNLRENLNTESNISQTDMDIIHCKVQMNQTLFRDQIVFSEKVYNLLATHLYCFDAKEFYLDSLNSTQSLFVDDKILELYQEKIAKPFGIVKNFFEILEFIKSRHELGVAMDQLLEFINCNKHSLEELEKYFKNFLFNCQMKKILFGVGIVRRVWVHRNYIHYWCVQSFRNLDFNVKNLSALNKSSLQKIQKIYFLPKLWKSPDGNLDINVLFLFFNRIITYLTINLPVGSVLEQLYLHFHKFIPKAQLEELLELLEFIECINIRKIIEKDRNVQCLNDFFSNNKTSSKATEKLKTIYEANIDAHSRLVSFYYILKQINI